MVLSHRARSRWDEFQQANRAEMDKTDQDEKRSRLSSAPMQTLHVAMIFEACQSAKKQLFQNRGVIEEPTLNVAIRHVEESLKAADVLDSIANKVTIAQEAEILLAHVRRDFDDHHHRAANSDFIIVTRTELTRRFCAHSGRRGSWKPEDLYLRYIPFLNRRRDAALVVQESRTEWYAFRAE
jgi:RNA-splicing ligase RtcB